MEKTQFFSNRDLKNLIVPLIVEQALAIFVGLADSIMVARVGETAVSGVSLIDNIMVLLIYIFSALATGGAVVAGQYLGQGKEDKARQAAGDLIWFTGLISLGIMVLLYLLKPFLLHVVFGKITAEVAGDAEVYLLIVALSIPFLAVFNGGSAVFRIRGNAKISMWISLLSNAVNIAGNALLIFGFSMGVEGVAIPTLVSRVLAAVFVLALLCRKDEPLRLEASWKHRFDWSMVKKILGIGIPSGLENGMFQLGKIILLSLVSTFGTTAIAANAVTGILASFQVVPGQAVMLAETTVISYCVGAGDYDQARYYNRKLLGITYGLVFAMTALVLAMLGPILTIYQLTEETARVTRMLVWLHGLGAILIWPLTFDLPAMFRAAGDVRFPMVISIVSMWIFRLFSGYLLGTVFGLGVLGVWIAMEIDWLFRTLVFGFRYFSGRWQGHQAV